MSNLIILIIIWLVPLGVCFWIWPVLRRSRGASVTAAILCLTPLWVHYPWFDHLTVWPFPLVLSIPAYIIWLLENPAGALPGILYMALPSGTIIGVLTWFAWGWVNRDK